MSGMALDRRCWNHDAREAVCRCPQCGRSFCRECVTEHESRLLCAACLRSAARAGPAHRGSLRRMAPTVMTLAGVLLAWAVYFTAAESLVTLTERAERVSWERR
jgi:hypothetical protein